MRWHGDGVWIGNEDIEGGDPEQESLIVQR